MELYNLIMLAYPAYTIKRIGAELTPRQVREMMACWQKDSPTFLTLTMIRRALWTFAGIPEQGEEVAAPQTEAEVLAMLRASGAVEGF